MSTSRFAVGVTWSQVVVEDLTRTRIVQYAGASGDFNPVHTDERHARDALGLPGVFAHGMLTMAMSGTVVSEVLGIENVTRFGGRFTAQVWPGDTLTVSVEVTRVEPGPDGGLEVDVSIRTTNQDRGEVFRGSATAVVPRTAHPAA